MVITNPPEGISYRRLLGGRYGYLLTSLILLMLIAPVLTGGGIKAGLVDLLVCGVMMSGIYAASPRKRSLAVGVLLAIAVLATHRLVERAPFRALFALHYALALSILIFAALTIFS